MKSYTFHVSIPGTGRVWRKIEMLDSQTLAELHLAIQDAFDFDRDHLYSFFMSGKAWDGSSEYRLPDDVPPWSTVVAEDEPEPDSSQEDRVWKLYQATLRQKVVEARQAGLDDEQIAFMEQAIQTAFFRYREPGDVRRTRLADLDLSQGQTFLYLFDYGDEWRFRVRVQAINQHAAVDADYPRIVERVGEAPAQYQSWSADE